MLRAVRPASPSARHAHSRGSVLVTAMILAAVLGFSLVSYLALSRTALKLAHRTLFINDANNLAEAGLEEAVYCFNQLSAGVDAATAWSGWTLTGANATRTLSPFNRDQNAIGTVKVFVAGYNGTNPTPNIISQATITPFDGGAPIVRVLQLGMQQGGGLFDYGIVGLTGVSLNGKPSFDSFNSNPTKSPTGPWLPYSSALAAANTTVVVPTGTLDLGGGTIKGGVLVGSSVTPPAASQVTGTIQTNFSGTFKMPASPTAASVSQSYNKGSSLPATLPGATDQPAADGSYYYFANGATIGNTTITAGKNVVIVGTSTSMSAGLAVATGATCKIYMDGTVSASGKGAINNGNWAGALQIYTTTSSTCNISGNGELQACVYAPNATLKANGGGSSGSIVGSFVAQSITANGHVDFHYDEALRNLNSSTASNKWSIASWSELRFGSDLSALSTATGNFLP